MSSSSRRGMRPYMLWLTRVYGRSIVGYGTAFMHWPNILDDWLRRCAEDRFRSESYPQPEPRPMFDTSLTATHTNTPRGTRLHVTHPPGEPGIGRAAGQGER